MFASLGPSAGTKATGILSSASNASTWFGSRGAMPATLIDGKVIAEQINAETVVEIARLKNRVVSLLAWR